MNLEELDERIRRLQYSRRRYSVAVRELQEIGLKITMLGRYWRSLLQTSG